MEKRKFAKVALLTAAMVAGANAISTNQVNAQIYVPTNYFKFEKCTSPYPLPNGTRQGGQCSGFGGNCLDFAFCS